MAIDYFLPPDTAIPDVTFIYDISSEIFIHIDPDFLKSIGLKDNVKQNGSIWNYIYQEDRDYMEEFLNEILNGTRIPSLEFRLKIHGEEKWLRISAIRLISKSGPILMGNAREVTTEVESMWTIRKYTNKKNAMLTVLSHDLRGPLSIAKSLSSMLEKNTSDEKVNKALNTITKIVEESLAMINDLLAREVFDSTSSDIVKIRTDVALKVKEYMEEYIASEWMSQRRFSFSTSHQSIMLGIDEAKFMQILNNFMSNSMKFTEPDACISVHLEQRENSVLMTFSDTGIGIPQEAYPEIFKKMSKAGRPGLNGEPSTGIGLFIVKSIIEGHDGQIWFESEVGKGTTFYVELPRF